jgi:hypothetical protein
MSIEHFVPLPEVLMRAVSATCGAALAVALMVLGLWGWQHAAEVATDATRPHATAWAVRSGAVAAAAAAQGLILILVVAPFYRRQFVDDVLRLATVVVLTLAAVAMIALGLAGR